MPEYTIGKMEMNFAQMIWEREPVRSGELVKLCEEQFGWKKSTTYTVLKRLCDRGLFINENGAVISLVSREEFLTRRSREFVGEAFGGSLPAFLLAFTRREKLSEKDIQELRKIVDRMDG